MRRFLSVRVIGIAAVVGLLVGNLPTDRAAAGTLYTWDGGDGSSQNWSTPDNWDAAGAPPAGASDTIVSFPGTSNVTSVNQDIGSPLVLNRLSMSGSTPAVSLTGGQLQFVVDGATQPQIYSSRLATSTIANEINIAAATTLSGRITTYGVTLLGEISGDGALVHDTTAGAGWFRLTHADNTYSGGTTYIGSGPSATWRGFTADASGALGTGDVTLIGGNLNPYDSSTNSHVGGLILPSAGTTFANNFNLQADSPIIIGMVGMAGGTSSSSTLTGDLDLNGHTLYLRGYGTGTASGVITDGSILKMDPGTWVLSGANTYTGPTTVNSGKLVFSGAQTSNASTSMSIASGATLEYAVASGLREENNVTYTGTGTLVKSGAGYLRWGVGAGRFNLGAGSLIDVQGGTFDAGSSANEVWSSNLSSLNVAAGATISEVTYGPAQFDALTGAGSVALHSGAGPGPHTLTIGVNNTATGAYNAAGTATFSGVISEGGSLIKTGTGTQILSRSNTYTGETIVNGGTLSLNGNQTIRIGNTLTINPGATVNLASGGDAVRDLASITIDGGTLADTSQSPNHLHAILLTSGRTLNLQNGATVTGTGAAAGNGTYGQLFLGWGGVTINVTGTPASTLNADIHWGNTNTINVASGSTLVVAGHLGNQEGTWWGYLNLTGDGTLIMTDGTGIQNTCTIGPGATMQIGEGGTTGDFPNGAAGGAGGVVNNGTVVFNRSNAYSPIRAISGTGAVVQAGSGTTTLTANNTYSGPTTVNAGTLVLTAANDGGGYRVFGSPMTINHGGTLSVDANGFFVDVTRDITLNGGVLAATGAFNANYGQIFLENGVKVIATGDNQSTLSAETHMRETHEFNVADGAAPIDLLVSGRLGNEEGTNWGYITKTGAGTMALNNPNNTFGGITVDAGTLLVAGSVNGFVTVNSGGTVSAGNSPGYMGVAGNYNQSGTMLAEIGGPNQGALVDGYDWIQVFGSATFDQGAVIDFDVLSGFLPEVGQIFDILTATQGITNSDLTGITFNYSGTMLPATFFVPSLYSPNPTGSPEEYLRLTVGVPEPSAFILSALGLLGLGLVGCRRRNR